jgi:hypothetical protein
VSAELATRRTAAAAALNDFSRWADGEIVGGDWRSWADRLAAQLRSLLEQLELDQAHVAWLAHQEIAATYQQPVSDAELLRQAILDGAYTLTDAEAATVLDALDVAGDCKRNAADMCSDCDADPAGSLCTTCEYLLTVADEYDALRERIWRTR